MRVEKRDIYAQILCNANALRDATVLSVFKMPKISRMKITINAAAAPRALIVYGFSKILAFFYVALFFELLLSFFWEKKKVAKKKNRFYCKTIGGFKNLIFLGV